MEISTYTKNLHESKICAFDSMLFIYLFEENPKYFKLVKSGFDLLDKGKIQIVTSIITPIEILSSSQLVNYPEKIKLYNNYFKTQEGLIVVDVNWELVDMATQIRRTYRLRTPDALQIAAALLSKAKIFVTNDHTLNRVKEIKIIQLN